MIAFGAISEITCLWREHVGSETLSKENPHREAARIFGRPSKNRRRRLRFRSATINRHGYKR